MRGADRKRARRARPVSPRRGHRRRGARPAGGESALWPPCRPRNGASKAEKRLSFMRKRWLFNDLQRSDPPTPPTTPTTSVGKVRALAPPGVPEGANHYLVISEGVVEVRRDTTEVQTTQTGDTRL